MDLNGIEAWARQMLEAEARRRGIRDPEFRGRAELIRLLIRDEYGDAISRGRQRVAEGVRTFEQARNLASVAMDAVATGLPGPLEAFMRLRSRTPIGEEPTPAQPSYSPPPASRPPVDATTAVELNAPQTPASQDESVQEHVRERVQEDEQQDGATTQHLAQPEAPTQPRAPTPTEGAAQPVAQGAERRARPKWPEPPPPTPEGPVTRAFTEEPIRTHSMARLLAGQGHRERALAIYEELLAQQSDDGELRREMEEIRRLDRGATVARELPAPPMPSTPVADDEIVCEQCDDDGIALRWRVTEQGVQRARRVLGEDGEFAVRVVAIVPDPDKVVRSDISEHGPVDATGRWQAAPIGQGARCLAAIGLRDAVASRFVSIAHVKPV